MGRFGSKALWAQRLQVCSIRRLVVKSPRLCPALRVFRLAGLAFAQEHGEFERGGECVVRHVR